MPYDAPTCAAEDAIEAALNELRLASFARQTAARTMASKNEYTEMAERSGFHAWQAQSLATELEQINARIDAATAILSGYFERAVAVAVEG